MEETDYSKIQDVMDKTASDAEYYMSITQPVIESYAQPLDELMKRIYSDVIEIEDPSISTIEKYFLELSNCLYFMCGRLEKLGSYDYVSKTLYKEAYNRAYLDNQSSAAESKDKKKTVSELTALSEECAKTEAVTNDIYSRAYKVVKSRIDCAQMMVSTLSKVMSRRMSEMNLADSTPVGKRILNE